MNQEKGPSEEDKKFKAPETGMVEMGKRKVINQGEDQEGMKDPMISSYEVSARRDRELLNIKTMPAERKAYFRLEARIYEALADGRRNGKTEAEIRAEEPSIFEEYDKISKAMTSEQKQEGENTARDINVS